jgi:hypothetical protein
MAPCLRLQAFLSADQHVHAGVDMAPEGLSPLRIDMPFGSTGFGRGDSQQSIVQKYGPKGKTDGTLEVFRGSAVSRVLPRA